MWVNRTRIGVAFGGGEVFGKYNWDSDTIEGFIEILRIEA